MLIIMLSVPLSLCLRGDDGGSGVGGGADVYTKQLWFICIVMLIRQCDTCIHSAIDPIHHATLHIEAANLQMKDWDHTKKTARKKIKKGEVAEKKNWNENHKTSTDELYLLKCMKTIIIPVIGFY